MKEITHYQLIGATYKQMTRVISKLIVDGYQPFGSPMMGDNYFFYQTMVKYKEDENVDWIKQTQTKLTVKPIVEPIGIIVWLTASHY